MSFEIHDKSDKTYIILGASHSATSLIAKALKDQGIDIKTTNTTFYESRDINRINDAIIRKSGGKWYRPPNKLMSGFGGKIKRFVKENKSKMWGFKDPRMSLTAQKWLPHLRGDVYLICCFRKPERVVKSWKNSIYPITKKVVDKYNKSILSIIKEFVGL